MEFLDNELVVSTLRLKDVLAIHVQKVVNQGKTPFTKCPISSRFCSLSLL